jgi:hypothetical protein
MVGIEGQVFATATFSGGNTTYGAPVGGAVVSTSLDATTATTNSSGSLRLVTTTLRANVSDCMRRTVTITAAGHPTYSVDGAWGPSEAAPPAQKLSLSPPRQLLWGANVRIRRRSVLAEPMPRPVCGLSGLI